jgi:hypothetical protein
MSETRKLAAILVADVVGYSRLAGADEERMLARLRVLRSDLIDPFIAPTTAGSISSGSRSPSGNRGLRPAVAVDQEFGLLCGEIHGIGRTRRPPPDVLRNLARLAIDRTNNSLASYPWTNQHGGRCVGLEHRDKSRIAARRYGRPEPEAARIGEQRVVVRRRRDRLVELNLINLAQQHAC